MNEIVILKLIDGNEVIGKFKEEANLYVELEDILLLSYHYYPYTHKVPLVLMTKYVLFSEDWNARINRSQIVSMHDKIYETVQKIYYTNIEKIKKDYDEISKDFDKLMPENLPKDSKRDMESVNKTLDDLESKIIQGHFGKDGANTGIH